MSKKRKRKTAHNKKNNRKDTNSSGGITFTQILVSVLLAILGASLTWIHHNHKSIQEGFDAQINSTMNISYVDEDLYTDCVNQKPIATLNNDIKSLKDNLGPLINQTYSLGRLLSLKTFCTIDAFTSWNDSLHRAGSKMCAMHLKNSDEIYTSRVHVVNQIDKNQKARENIFSSLQEFFSDEKEEKYRPSDCSKYKYLTRLSTIPDEFKNVG